jgi:23S rRNA (uracil1939-C5)-methyltransferase
VPFALPGELARVRLVEEKRGYARAALVEILEPAPERVAPRCKHYTACGGCHYQHMAYPAQLTAKREILRDQLSRIGGLAAPPVGETIPAPQPWNYRNHVQFHLTQEGRLGYMAAGSEQVIAIQECHLPEALLNETWPQIDLEPIPGLERLGLRGGSGDDILLALESSDPQPPELTVELSLSAVHLGPAGATLLAGDDHLVIEALGRPFRVSAGSFFQVHTAMAERMAAYLLEHLRLTPQTRLLEVYCGVGLFSAFLAGRVAALVGVEESPQACLDFEANLDEFDNVSLYEGPAEAVLPGLDFRPDIVLVDPPRAGLSGPALDGVLRLAPATLAYVSCDPATLARDAKRLGRGGYRLVSATPFDLFPQTYHIESISLWQPA